MSARWKPFLRWQLLVGLTLAGLAVNAWVHVGTAAFLVVAFTAVAFLLLVGVQFVGAGYFTAKHAMREEQAIAAIEADRHRRRVHAGLLAVRRQAEADARYFSGRTR